MLSHIVVKDFNMGAKIPIEKICAIYAPHIKVKKKNFPGMNIFYFCWILLLSTFK